VHFYQRTTTSSEDELARAIPGAEFHVVANSGPTFSGRYRHLVLDGMVLSHLEFNQGTILILREREVNFPVWHLLTAPCSANGADLKGEEMAMVRPGEGGTMHSATPIGVRTFGLQPALFAEAPELDLPFGPRPARSAGRWRVASIESRRQFSARHLSVFDQIDSQPALLEAPATRVTMRNAILEAIAQLGEQGAFSPDRAAAGRHTRIMLRFERLVEDSTDEPLTMSEICRRAGTSRRSLEAVVLERTGKSPWEYLRWRRLWRAHALLCQPDTGTTVTDVAFKLGFWHLGRFAAAYASTFGERPSLTLARAKGILA
jgi:AraC-like DNA-binding protein